MGRTTNTRELVRAEAEKLSHEGLAPEEITVDLVLRNIGQGSRTTINDAIKLWRKERQIAMPSEVPTALVPVLSALWQAALDEAAKSYQQAREEFTEQVTSLTEARDGAESQLAERQRELDEAQGRLRQAVEELEKRQAAAAKRENDLQRELAVKTQVIDALEARNQAANERMVEMQRATMLRLAEQKSDFELRLTEVHTHAATAAAQAEQAIAALKQSLADLEGKLAAEGKRAASLQIALVQSEGQRQAAAGKNEFLELRVLELSDQVVAQTATNQAVVAEKEKELKRLLVSEASALATIEELRSAEKKQSAHLESLERRIESLIEKAAEAGKEGQKMKAEPDDGQATGEVAAAEERE